MVVVVALCASIPLYFHQSTHHDYHRPPPSPYRGHARLGGARRHAPQAQRMEMLAARGGQQGADGAPREREGGEVGAAGADVEGVVVCGGGVMSGSGGCTVNQQLTQPNCTWVLPYPETPAVQAMKASSRWCASLETGEEGPKRRRFPLRSRVHRMRAIDDSGGMGGGLVRG